MPIILTANNANFQALQKIIDNPERPILAESIHNLIYILKNMLKKKITIFFFVDDFTKEEFYTIKTSLYIFNKIGSCVSLVILGNTQTYLEKLFSDNQTNLIQSWILITENNLWLIENQTGFVNFSNFKEFIRFKNCWNNSGNKDIYTI